MNRKDMLSRSLFNNLLALLIAITAHGQDTVTFRIPNDNKLVNYAENKIQNAPYLNPFFEKLYQLKKNKKDIVNILHIGDSHVQADYITHQLRQNFQIAFGNAGRGFLFPIKVAQSNEPANFNSSSTGKWDAKRNVFTDQPLPIGLGGFTIRTLDEEASLKIQLKNYPGLNYGFNKITTFFFKEPKGYHIAIQDSLNQILGYVGNFSDSETNHSATIKIPTTLNTVQFKNIKNLPNQERSTYFGFSFENGLPGVLYHSIGANGAKYKHYLAAEFFIEQTISLHPDLIIVSLGTNEAIDHPYQDPKFKQYVTDFINQLKQKNPNALFLMATPPDGYRKKNKRNPGVSNIKKQLIEVAESAGIAYYDYYEASGGNHSADDWKKASYLRDDGVHFTRAGYELQGNMYYDAIIKAYNSYVSNRRQ